MSAQRGKPRSPGGSPGGRGSGRGDSARRGRTTSARRVRGADAEAADSTAKASSGRFWSRLPSTDNTVFGLSTSRAVVLAMVVLMLALTLAVPLRTYISQRSDAAQIAAERSVLQKEVDELRAQNARFDDPAYIEALARERLRYVKPGETPFQVQLPGDYKEPEKKKVKETPLTGPWYRDLWQTISEPPVVPETKPKPAPAPATPTQQPEEQGVPTG
ncbi:septum formation initiator [Rhodococcus sp. SRB_17]|uniref:FtsB family cell division protein n=1 Tax=Rhodococcus sp. OK302 TaxID=1882769 RepID=UPI000B944FEC|nr:septum formation initiator family protein [Rhodococcus sp. OK302]NMM83554.1 septum formation initiator [Rhodococcus sp. SRB_17]OYD71656.1 cell division protein FtsB [Rhodococcus sp. OK302]